MANQLIYNYLLSRNTLFIFSLLLILISMSTWLSFSGYHIEIHEKIFEKGELFKTPHTTLRYIIFSFGFFLMIYSFSLSLNNERFMNSFMIVVATYSIPLFFLLNLVTLPISQSLTASQLFLSPVRHQVLNLTCY